MSLKFLAPAVVALTAAFVSPSQAARIPETCPDIVDTDLLADTLVYYEAADWSPVLTNLGVGELEQLAEVLDGKRSAYKKGVDNTFKKLARDAKSGEIDWENYYENSTFAVRAQFDELRAGNPTDADVNDMLPAAQKAMSAYMDGLLDRVNELMQDAPADLCPVVDGAKSPQNNFDL